MTRLEWQDSVHALQGGPMDTAHQEFVTLTNALADAPDAEELARLTQLFVHCKEHFAQDKAWMQTSQMPAIDNHLRDHEGVLTLLESAAADLRAGTHGAGRDVAESLAAWFGQHAATLDAALAFHMQQAARTDKPGIPAVG